MNNENKVPDGVGKRKRQVRTQPASEVRENLIKLKKLEEEIETLKRQNAELEKYLSSSSNSSPVLQSQNYGETETCVRFGLNEIKSILPEFNPDKSQTSAFSWIENIESLRKLYMWNDRITLFYASSQLSGAASTWYIGNQNKLNEWNTFKSEFVLAFPSYTDTSSILLQIMLRKRQKNEAIENYFYDIVALGRKINLPDNTIIKHIISNINDSSLANVLMSVNRNELSLNELLAHIKRCEEILSTEKQGNLLLSQSGKQNLAQRSYRSEGSFNKYARQYHPYRHKNVNNRPTKSEQISRENVKRCFKCNESGHFANNCSVKSVRRCFKCNAAGHISRECNMNSIQEVGDKNEFSDEYHKTVFLEGNPIKAFLDLGSECTTLKHSVLKVLNYDIEKCNTVLYGFGGGKIKVIGKINKYLKVDDFEFKVDIMIVEDSNQKVPMIIGKNFMDRPGVKIVKRWGTFSLEIDTPEIANEEKSVLAIKTLAPIDLSMVQIENNITEKIKMKLIKLINQYRSCFATNIKELGHTSVVEMRICLKENKVIKQRPYKVPYAMKPILDDSIKELLELGVIQPSVSEFTSPVLLVKKKDNEYRMCVDFRRLNAITKRETFPVPNIEETLNSLNNKSIFTTLDLLSGYHQIEVNKDCRHLTSFVTPSGQYEYKRMPFGLTNSPAVFMRMMTKILEPIKSDNIIVYMDDILIATTTLEENLEILEHFLKILKEAGLTLKLEKCIFFQNKIQFLGHEISAGSIKPGATKTAAIENYKRPENIKEVRQFLGLAGYFRRFVKNFANIAQPLNRLLRKGEQFIWNIETENAFQKLKNELIRQPILVIYDVNKQHELHTDASCKGIAGILMQKENEHLKPVSFFSRATTTAEQKYHSYELEALAVVESLERFKFYLLNKHFKIVTDCSSLKMTHEKQHIVPRIARWWLKILEFDFELEYRPGLKLGHADALSRSPHEAGKETDTVAARLLVVGMDLEDWISTLQLQDPNLKEIKDVLDGTITDHSEKYIIKKNFVLKGGRIYKKTDSGERFVVPNGLRWRVIKATHDDMGHCSYAKTLINIRKIFWFQNMALNVKKYIKSCIECAYNKRGDNENKYILYEPERQPVPFYVIHLDHLGPFPKSKSGKEYVIGLIDSFTKFVVLKSVKTTSTKSVLLLLDEVTQYFGMPTRIITDRGSAYTAKEFEKYCSENLIKHVKTAVKTPRANGQIERYFRTIKAAVSSMTEMEDGRDWDKKIVAIQWALNSMQHSTTKQTPQELLMNYHPRSILKNKLILALHDESRKDDEDDIPLAELRERALNRIKENQHKQSTRHNQSQTPPLQFKEGQLVLIRREPVATGQSKKVQPRYKGPYQVRSKLGNDRYLITDPDTIQLTQKPYESVHSAEHIKPWFDLTDTDFDLNVTEEDDDELLKE